MAPDPEQRPDTQRTGPHHPTLSVLEVHRRPRSRVGAPGALAHHSRLWVPFCSGRRVSMTNSVRALMGTAISRWHPTRNGHLTPDEVLAGTSGLVWWKCPVSHDHEWQCAPAVLRRRLGTTHKGCPFCAGMRPSVTNNFARKPRHFRMASIRHALGARRRHLQHNRCGHRGRIHPSW